MPEQLQLTLNPSGVAAPAQRVATIASQVVATCLRGIEADHAELPILKGGNLMGYTFTGFDVTPEERRQTFANWILSKGFQDLARGVRETLEEAAVYLDIMTWEPGLTTLAEVEAKIASTRAEAQRPQFPALLARVNARLTEPMAFEAEFLSMQRVRNCLEHRGGRVELRDVDPASRVLSLTFPRLKMFYMLGDEEVELVAGEVIDTYAPGVRQPGDGMVQIFVKRVTRVRDFKLGEAVAISAADFAEVAMACHFFGDDLAQKLPALSRSSALGD